MLGRWRRSRVAHHDAAAEDHAVAGSTPAPEMQHAVDPAHRPRVSPILGTLQPQHEQLGRTGEQHQPRHSCSAVSGSSSTLPGSLISTSVQNTTCSPISLNVHMKGLLARRAAPRFHFQSHLMAAMQRIDDPVQAGITPDSLCQERRRTMLARARKASELSGAARNGQKRKARSTDTGRRHARERFMKQEAGMELLINIDVDDLEHGIGFYEAGLDWWPGRRPFANSVAEMHGACAPIYLSGQGGRHGYGAGRCAARLRAALDPVHLDSWWKTSKRPSSARSAPAPRSRTSSAAGLRLGPAGPPVRPVRPCIPASSNEARATAPPGA